MNCKTCAFSTWNDEENIQTGCFLNRLNTFKERGQVKDLIEDSLSFSSVKGICAAHRDQKWAKRLSPDEVFNQPLWAETVKEELKLKIDVVIVHRTNRLELEHTLRSLNFDFINSITVTCYEDEEPVSLLERLRKLPKQAVAARIFTKFISFEETLLGLKGKIRGNYVLVCESGFRFKSSFFVNFDHYINTDYYYPVLIYDNDITLVHSGTYRFLEKNGNYPIKFLKEQKDSSIIGNGYNFVCSLQQ